MSRRFTLFALLTAVCLLFASCGALFLKTPVSNKGSIVIPLRASDRKASNPLASSPLELCTRFVFSIENANYKGTAEGTTTIEFGEIPFGTYTLTGTAYGKLSEETGALEEIVATCKVENLVIDSPEPKAVTATFVLSEATLIYFNGYEVEETDAQGTPITVVYTGTDKTTKISETVTTEIQGITTTTVKEYAFDADGNNQKITVNGLEELFVAKETVTEPQSSGNKITVTEYDYNAGNPQVSKTTVTEPDGKKTVSEFNLNTTTQGCSKRVTIEEGNTTTVDKYASNTAETPTDRVVTTIGTTETTILTYDQSNMTHPASKAEIITTGSNKGQKTETEYNTSIEKPVKETVTSPDNHKTVSTFDYSVNNQTTTTTYQTDWIPGGGTSGSATQGNPDTNHIEMTVEKTMSGSTVTQTKTSLFSYFNDINAKNVNGEAQIPFDTVTVEIRNSVGELTSTQVTTYQYETNGMPKNIITVDPFNPSVELAFQKYTYKDNGTPNTIATKNEGEEPKYFSYRPIGLKVYSDTSMTSSLIFESTGTTFFECPCDNSNFDNPDASKIPAETIAKYLEDHYVLVGNTIQKENVSGKDEDDLNFITTAQIEDAHNATFKYIFKVNFTRFLETGCFKKGDIVSEGTGDAQCFYLKCYLHNDKGSCSNFWGSNYNFSTAKSKYIITTTNYGCADDSDYPGVGKTNPIF
ncbi:MAG: hypothetical protein KBT02_07915 [Treponema sp.]|nr:hypothetical protein [Candidatus Treponema caballi]